MIFEGDVSSFNTFAPFSDFPIGVVFSGLNL